MRILTFGCGTHVRVWRTVLESQSKLRTLRPLVAQELRRYVRLGSLVRLHSSTFRCLGNHHPNFERGSLRSLSGLDHPKGLRKHSSLLQFACVVPPPRQVPCPPLAHWLQVPKKNHDEGHAGRRSVKEPLITSRRQPSMQVRAARLQE